jgi:hypothetical protein
MLLQEHVFGVGEVHIEGTSLFIEAELTLESGCYWELVFEFTPDVLESDKLYWSCLSFNVKFVERFGCGETGTIELSVVKLKRTIDLE